LANGHGLREAGAAGLFLSETSARLSGQRGQRARKKTEAILEVRIIMACTIYHVHGGVQPARGGAVCAIQRNTRIEIK
jgi:hypothetical protein